MVYQKVNYGFYKADVKQLVRLKADLSNRLKYYESKVSEIRLQRVKVLKRLEELRELIEEETRGN